jgi:hypothetical protein
MTLAASAVALGSTAGAGAVSRPAASPSCSFDQPAGVVGFTQAGSVSTEPVQAVAHTVVAHKVKAKAHRRARHGILSPPPGQIPPQITKHFQTPPCAPTPGADQPPAGSVPAPAQIDTSP